MPNMYFSKFNINSEIYEVYDRKITKDEILNRILEKIDTTHIYSEFRKDVEYGERCKEIKKLNQEIIKNHPRYKFCDLEKDKKSRTITGKLVKIYNGEIENYVEDKDTVESKWSSDCVNSCMFYFDLEKEEIAFTVRRGFGYRQFNKYFKALIETYFDNMSFKIFLETNTTELKNELNKIDRILKIEVTLIPPNANSNDFNSLFGPTGEELKSTCASTYKQEISVSARSKKKLNINNTFIDRIMWGIEHGYGKLVANGLNRKNEKVRVSNEETAPYVKILTDNERNDIESFKEIAQRDIQELVLNRRCKDDKGSEK